MDKKLHIETSIRSLYSYLEDLKIGALQIPAFQRGFVWERDNIKDLFDSIKNSYPIGSILLWKPNEPHWKSQEIIGSYYIPKKENDPLYVLDGFQRLSCLFGCLTNPNKIGLQYNKNLRDEYFDLYYDLEDEIFIYLRSGAKKLPHQLPIYILMSSSDFRQYSRNEIEPLVDSSKIDIYLDRADKLSRVFLDYKIASIEIRNANIEEAVEIFSRINSKGTEISFDWMVNALSISSNFRFGDEIDKLLNELKVYNFDTIKRDVIFRCIQSSFGKLYIDQTNIEELARRTDFAEKTKATIPFIKKAVDFLYKEINVVDAKLLPYNIQLIFVMDFFKKINNPTKTQINDLKRWFWSTTYANYFTIYSLSNQRRAYEYFHKYLDGISNDLLFNDNKNIRFKISTFPEKVTMGSVRSKALILFLLNHTYKFDIERASSGFFIQKIFQNTNSAVNIIPMIECQETLKYKKSKDMSNYIKNLTEDEKNNILFTEEMSLLLKQHKIDEILVMRKKLIQSKEREFVKSIGLEYTD
ncbi:DUF262 domain-containing protein [uncultured Bacteroides sp.]|uniref:DUF262 domain-containing protein n=1 Tax=uncultured Bacteroides sp. TaxID=162156 RepID=UPI002AAB3D4A|nr:DUF262 domain-containing protein [uncultured Bacteroides sp.]